VNNGNMGHSTPYAQAPSLFTNVRVSSKSPFQGGVNSSSPNKNVSFSLKRLFKHAIKVDCLNSSSPFGQEDS
jgi:hypothetical protein